MATEMTAERAGGSRALVSLRVPKQLAEQVEQYARDNGLRKTDAYLRFITKGLQNERDVDETSRLAEIQDSLNKVLDCLRPTKVETNAAAEREGDYDKVRTAVIEASQQFPAIRSAYLFGSFARKTYGPASDVDVRIEVERDKGFNLHDLAHFMKGIEQATGREVDVVSADVIKNQNLAAAIEREKVLVYEREEQ
jgi:predicted nucleotidyltransferase